MISSSQREGLLYTCDDDDMSLNYQDISQQEKLVPQAKSILRAMPMWKLQLGENPSKRGNFKSVTEWSPQEEYM